MLSRYRDNAIQQAIDNLMVNTLSWYNNKPDYPRGLVELATQTNIKGASQGTFNHQCFHSRADDQVHRGFQDQLHNFTTQQPTTDLVGMVKCSKSSLLRQVNSLATLPTRARI